MKRFYQSNKILTQIFIFVIVISLSYIMSMKMPEWFNGAELWFNLVFQLSIGFIINFMFYVTQVYIPNSKKDKLIKECINIRLSNIISFINNNIDILGQKYIDNHFEDIYTDDELFKILLNLQFSDKVNVMNASTMKNFTVGEWIGFCIYRTEKEIDNLYKYYTNYVSADLMKILEKVLNSNYHKDFPVILGLRRNYVFNKIEKDVFFKQYYGLSSELKDIRDKKYL